MFLGPTFQVLGMASSAHQVFVAGTEEEAGGEGLFARGEGEKTREKNKRRLSFFSSSASLLFDCPWLSLSPSLSFSSFSLVSRSSSHVPHFSYLAEDCCAGRESGRPAAAGALAAFIDESKSVFRVFFGFSFAGDIGQRGGRGSRPLAARRHVLGLRIASGDHFLRLSRER